MEIKFSLKDRIKILFGKPLRVKVSATATKKFKIKTEIPPFFENFFGDLD